MSARVLFVSKPIAPPFHDGTKCLVRDVAGNLREVTPTVMSSSGAPALRVAPGAQPVHMAPVYKSSGGFAPALSDNLRAAIYLLFSARADVWHFVFAPNPRSSAVGRYAKGLRRVPVLQTIASPPKTFADIGRLLFGDLVVAQSRWTLARVEEAYDQAPGLKRPRLEVIPPPVPVITARSASSVAALRHKLGIPAAAPVFVYPGDLETSVGAETVAKLVAPLVAQVKDAIVVFAYRAKTAQAPLIAERLQASLAASQARFVSELPDVLELIAGATAVLFPVDDLRGKVDLPIVLLEAMDLGIPVLALDHGPLCDLEGAWRIAGTELGPWLTAARTLLEQPTKLAELVAEQRRAVATHYRDHIVAARYERLYLELTQRVAARRD